MTPPVVGVLGGGQLGRMFVQAAGRLGVRVHVFADQAESPAGRLAASETVGRFDDDDAVEAFARTVEVLTWEVESVAATAVARAAGVTSLRPGAHVLEIVQDRIAQRAFLRRLGVPVGEYREVRTADDARRASSLLGPGAFLKRSQGGFDGRSQARVWSDAEASRAWAALGAAPSVMERPVPFEHEFSVIVARNEAGSIIGFPPIENRHVEGILDVAVTPAAVPAESAARAREMVETVARSLGLVGVLCAECYLLADGGVLVNEIAARTHNSGHLTIEAFTANQFELHVRAVAGLPLVQPVRVAPAAAMANILGPLPKPLAALCRDRRQPGVAVHDYEKAPRPGRKVGHITALGATPEEAVARVRAARAALTGDPAPCEGAPVS
ncbi:MAG: 5-(carboxyamino)imidazole ribonucleotide synthase [Dehalococcoidia bacterium]